MKVAGKIVVITGASSGLGRALALELADRGAAGIALMARREASLKEVAGAVEAKGARALVVAADVADGEAVAQAVAAAEAALGPIDVAVANAGVGIPQRATEPGAAILRKTFEINVFGVGHLLDAVLPAMLARGRGQLVAVSSVAGVRGLPGNAIYSASKAAVTNLMEGYGLELAPRGITTTTLEPGFVRTEMTAKNHFKMPFLLEADEAARIMADAIESDTTRLAFPWQMGLVMGSVRLLPTFAFKRVGALFMRSRPGWDGSDR